MRTIGTALVPLLTALVLGCATGAPDPEPAAGVQTPGPETAAAPSPRQQPGGEITIYAPITSSTTCTTATS